MTMEEQICRTCCFLGHREIIETRELKEQILHILEKLIVDQNVDTFLFGSKSSFNSLCHALVTQLKEQHPHIKRIYVRAEFPVIDRGYKEYLLEGYEDTYYPENIKGAGKAVYIKRNYTMIQNSQYCIFYYDEGYTSTVRKSGTKIALTYAKKYNKAIYIFPILCTASQVARKESK